MKNFSKFILSLLMILITFNTLRAQDDLQLAISYYNQKQYEKASPIFQRLYNQRHTKFYFDYYLRCLINQQEYKKAERAIRREIRRNPEQKSFLVDLAHIYELQGKQTEADRIYKSLISKPPQSRSMVVQIGNSLVNYHKYQLAEHLYQKAHKTTGQNFFNELYVVYILERNSEKLVDLLLDWLEYNPAQLSMIEARLLPNVNNDVNNEFSSLLERKTKEKIKKSRDIAFYKLLIWLYIEKKNLSSALEMAMKMDKRTHGFGKNVFDIGQIARDYDSLNIARQAFEYLINKGMEYPYYSQSRQQLLGIYYKQIQSGQIHDPKEIKNIENQYIQTINELSLSNKTINTIIQLAHLEAFYLHNQPKALTYLNQALRIRSLNNQMRANLLMEKAKVLLTQHKPWDAIILFNKIFYDYPSLPQAFAARLMMAKTFMYIGDMEGAKMYLDKLRGYTSTPEANDAIINDFFIARASDDSTKMQILKIFARAQYYDFCGDVDSASVLYDSVAHYASFLADRALLEKAKMLSKHLRYQQAVNTLEELINSFYQSTYLDQAYFMAAQIYQKHLGDTDKAMEYYKKILFDLRDSPLVAQARKNFRRLSHE